MESAFRSMNMLTGPGISFMMRLAAKYFYLEKFMSRRNNIFSLIFTIIIWLLIIGLTATGWGVASPPTIILTLLAIVVLLLDILRSRFPVFYFSMMLKLFPRRVAYYTYRGGAYITRKQDKLALEDLNRAVELGSKMAETYSNRGHVYLNRKEYQEAIQDFDYALSLNPHFAVGYNNRGWAYLGLKEYQRAIQDFEQSIELFPYFPYSHHGKGFAHSHLGEWAQVIPDLDRAIYLYSGTQQSDKSSFAEIYRTRGTAYYIMGEYMRALENFQYAIILTPQNARLYNYTGLTCIFLKDYQQALQACNQALVLVPDMDRAYTNRGKAYLGLDDLQRARADFAKAVEIDPEFVSHTWYLEWVRFCQESPNEEAAKRLEAIAEKSGKHPQAYNCKGVAAWIRGASENALQEFEQSIQIKPIQWDAYFWKGVALASLGRDEEARAAIQAALDHSMPPILLSPLRWLEKDRPDFYREVALPLFVN